MKFHNLFSEISLTVDEVTLTGEGSDEFFGGDDLQRCRLHSESPRLSLLLTRLLPLRRSQHREDLRQSTDRREEVTNSFTSTSTDIHRQARLAEDLKKKVSHTYAASKVVDMNAFSEERREIGGISLPLEFGGFGYAQVRREEMKREMNDAGTISIGGEGGNEGGGG